MIILFIQTVIFDTFRIETNARKPWRWIFDGSSWKKKNPRNQKSSEGRHEDVNNYQWDVRQCHILGVEDVLTTFIARILTSSQPNFQSRNDVILDVQMTKLLSSKWPIFWCPNDKSFDVQMTKLVIYLSYLLTTEQSLIYSISTATL